jgi:Fungalysin metallopeptidase (M36)/Peptidase propeptide and YPEB domain
MSSHPVSRRRRAQAIVGVTAVVGLLGAGPAMSAANQNSAKPTTAIKQLSIAATTAVPSNVKLLQTRTSLLGVHQWYRQMRNGYPVVGGLFARHTDTTGATRGHVMIWDGRVNAGPLATTKATVAAATAIHAAAAATKGTPLTIIAPHLWVLPGAQSHLVWAISTYTDSAGYVSYVDAASGKVLKTIVDSRQDSAGSPARFVDGSARVFDPNPVVKLQDEDLKDTHDVNSSVPANGYSIRVLGHLDASHTLVGEWAKVINAHIAKSQDNSYMFMRHNNQFEQVMDYYALDTEESYYQSLGFTDVNAEPQRIEANAMADDNSWYLPSQDLIQTGTGGVDDAEDPEVVWHEDGHATQDDQVPGFGRSEQAGAIGEGFGDYMAVTMGQIYGKDTKLTPTTCVMDWDSTSYTPGPKHCLRTTDTDKIYPDDLDGEVHDDGEIWSHALWNMNVALGRDRATTAVIEAQFSFNPSINMPDAAKLVVDTAKKLYGTHAAAKTRQAFQDRGIL